MENDINQCIQIMVVPCAIFLNIVFNIVFNVVQYFILKLIQFHVNQMFKITWVRASPSVRGMEAARSRSERASVNTKMFRAGKFLRTNQCQYQRTLGKILTLFHPGGRQFYPHRLSIRKITSFSRSYSSRTKWLRYLNWVIIWIFLVKLDFKPI